MEYFVSPSGDDANPGTNSTRPFRTIERGLHGASAAKSSRLKPGDILTLAGGVYHEALTIARIEGTPGNEITIRARPGECAAIDSGMSAFREKRDPPAWSRAITVDPKAHPDEWVSEKFPKNVKPNRGAFLDMPYRRLVTYSTIQDFRSDKQTSERIFDVDAFDENRGPWKVTDDTFKPLLDPPVTGREFTFPWVYMGPGLFLDTRDHATNRVHVRLSHTSLGIPGLEDYIGPTDPNQIRLAVCLENTPTLTILNSRCLIFSNLTIRFGGTDTIFINRCESLTFDEVNVFASTRGIRFGAVTGATFRNCRFDGGTPPWFFRTDRKSEYDCLLTPAGERFHNARGKNTVDVLMYGQGANKQDIEIHHCEFVNGHDLYLVAEDTHFHHNWIDNLHDEGMVLDAAPSASGRIHSNVVTRCLSAISLAGDVFTTGPWFIYRNLIDLRQPTCGIRPRHEGDTNVFRFGSAFKSNESPSALDGPHDMFHNTFLVAEQREQATYLHYRSALSPHLRRSFNNIFVAVNSSSEVDVALTIVPPPSFPGPTDGNLYHRYGVATNPAFRSLPYDFDGVHFEGVSYNVIAELHNSDLFHQSKTQYAPGYEARSQLADPEFRKIAANGDFHPLDDLRISEQSPARLVGVPLPPDLQALDDSTTAPLPPSQAAGCYPFGSEPLNVGVHGRRRFPVIGIVP